MSNTKANPLKWVWNQARGAFRKLRGGRVQQVVKPSSVNRDRYLEQERGQGIAQDLMGQLFGGDMSVQQWQLGFRRELKDVFFNQYRLGRGGTANMTQADYGRLGGVLRNQYQYMNRFAEDLAAGRLTEAQAKIRADMYIKAARSAYERGKWSIHGMPNLPAYPGDGQTQCLSNCQCSWDVQETEDAFFATWTLGAAEHCPDCMQNASNWAPLRLPKL